MGLSNSYPHILFLSWYFQDLVPLFNFSKFSARKDESRKGSLFTRFTITFNVDVGHLSLPCTA